MYNTSTKIKDHIENLRKNAANPSEFWRSPMRTKRNQTHISYTETPPAKKPASNNNSSVNSYLSAASSSVKTSRTEITQLTTDTLYIDKRFEEVIQICEAKINNAVQPVSEKLDNFIDNTSGRLDSIDNTMNNRFDEMNENFKKLLTGNTEQPKTSTPMPTHQGQAWQYPAVSFNGMQPQYQQQYYPSNQHPINQFQQQPIYYQQQTNPEQPGYFQQPPTPDNQLNNTIHNQHQNSPMSNSFSRPGNMDPAGTY